MGFLEETMSRLKSQKFWLVMLTSMATAIGSFGGFPTPPPIFLKIAKNNVVQWFLMFILILQGGSGFDFIYAGVATAFVFVLYKVVSMIPVSKEVQKVVDKISKNEHFVAPTEGQAVDPPRNQGPTQVQMPSVQKEHYQEDMDPAEIPPEHYRQTEHFNPQQEQAPSGYSAGGGFGY